MDSQHLRGQTQLEGTILQDYGNLLKSNKFEFMAQVARITFLVPVTKYIR